jgi:hypothetical protein
MRKQKVRIHSSLKEMGRDASHRTAASLHCHTHFSREILSFIPYYASQTPILSGYFASALKRYREIHQREMDFGQAYWTPPVTPQQVIEAETRQIEKLLGLPALISITDHDEIEAGLRLQVFDHHSHSPISLEWTVPYRQGFFHLGIHNLPAGKAREQGAALMRYTRQEPGTESLRDLLAMLNENPGTLVVLNHPLWDIELIGEEAHRQCLRLFLEEHACWLHALEINGFRKWAENQETIQLAADLALPVVSGGDRHGCQPNTVLNLTQARSFDELVAEVRVDRYSEILLLPSYLDSMVMRILESVAEVIRTYPDHPLGRKQWCDRIYFNLDGHETKALSHYWPNGGPGWIRSALWILRCLGSKQLKPALRLALTQESIGERIGYTYES